MASILEKYKKEILQLRDQGYSSYKIQNYLQEKYKVKTSSRSVRRIYQKYGEVNTFENQLEESGFALPENWSHGWLKGKEASIFIRNTSEQITFEEMRESFIDKLKSYSPTFKKIKRKELTDKHCLVIDIADLHIGKLSDSYETGEDYNSNIAVQKAKEGIEGILAKAKGFPLEKIIFVIGNDVLHVDNTKRTTTSGTPQDTDGMWYRNYLIARDLYVEIIELLLQVCDVHIVHNMSNHDYVTGFMLADSIYCWFRKCKNITWDIDASHRKYVRYGNSLIGLSHGDGGKMDQLPLTMATESKDWSDCKYRYIYLHHIHHNAKFKFMTTKDLPGITVEYLRSPSGTDSWHHKNQHQNSFKAIEAFIHSDKHGQVAKISHLF